MSNHDPGPRLAVLQIDNAAITHGTDFIYVRNVVTNAHPFAMRRRRIAKVFAEAPRTTAVSSTTSGNRHQVDHAPTPKTQPTLDNMRILCLAPRINSASHCSRLEAQRKISPAQVRNSRMPEKKLTREAREHSRRREKTHHHRSRRHATLRKNSARWLTRRCLSEGKLSTTAQRAPW